MNSDQKARMILSRVLSIPAASVDSSVQLGATKQWDSIAHMNLVLSIEEEIGRKLLPPEYLKIDGFDSLKGFFEAENI